MGSISLVTGEINCFWFSIKDTERRVGLESVSCDQISFQVQKVMS
jgi:hypothetical protein